MVDRLLELNSHLRLERRITCRTHARSFVFSSSFLPWPSPRRAKKTKNDNRRRTKWGRVRYAQSEKGQI